MERRKEAKKVNVTKENKEDKKRVHENYASFERSWRASLMTHSKWRRIARWHALHVPWSNAGPLKCWTTSASFVIVARARWQSFSARLVGDEWSGNPLHGHYSSVAARTRKDFVRIPAVSTLLRIFLKTDVPTRRFWFLSLWCLYIIYARSESSGFRVCSDYFSLRISKRVKMIWCLSLKVIGFLYPWSSR